jgi:single-strand DNA-binding protein
MAKGMNTQIVAGKVTKVETREVNGKNKSRITVKGFPFYVIAWDAEVQEGDTIFAHGRVQTRSYEKDGQTQYITEVIVRQIIDLDEKAGNVTVAIGNLGRSPEMRYTSTGKAVTNFSMAANVFGSDAPEWFSVTTWEKLAEICEQYLGKGDRVAVAGRLNLDSWEDDAGQKHYRTKLTANEMLMLGGKANGGSAEANEMPGLSEIEDIPF